MKKDKLKNFLNQFKEIFVKFPLTLVTIIVLTVFYAIILDTDILSNKVIQNISIFGFLFGYTSFFIESVFETKPKTFKIISYICNIVISAIITIGFNQEGAVVGLSNEKFLEYLGRATVCYILSITIYAIIENYKKSNCSFNEYVTKVAVNMFKTTIVYGLLAIGLLLICLASIILLLEKNDYMLVARIQILLVGLYYIPKMMYTFADSREEIAKFAKVVIKYVLDTLVFVAFVIIYLYIIKLIILRQMPSNQIFRICAGLFILGCPIWTMASYFKDKDIFEKINNKLPYAFIPFILLQIYSIWVRIIEYGVTPLRYLCLALIIFEIMYLIIYFKNKENIERVLYVLIVLILISGITPYVNMFKLSQISQYNNLKIVKQSSDLTEQEKKKVRGSYNYLIGSDEGEGLINSLLTQEEKDRILDYNNYETIRNSKEYLYGTNNSTKINIEGYNKLYKIDESDYSEYSQRLAIDTFSSLKIELEDNRTIEINLKNLIEDYIAHQKTFDKYFEEHNEYIIDSNQKIILENVSITYYKDSKEISSYSIQGYFLTK